MRYILNYVYLHIMYIYTRIRLMLQITFIIMDIKLFIVEFSLFYTLQTKNYSFTEKWLKLLSNKVYQLHSKLCWLSN